MSTKVASLSDRAEHTNWLSNAKQSSLKTCIQVPLNECNRMHFRAYTHKCAIMVGEKEATNLKGEQEGVGGTV